MRLFKLFYSFGFITVFVLAMTVEYNAALETALALFVLSSSVLFCVQCRKNYHLFLLSLFILYFNYSILVCSYLHIIKYIPYSRYAHTALSFSGIKVLSLFTVLLYVLFPQVKADRDRQSVYGIRDNQYITLFLMVLLLFIFVFGYKRPERIGERGTPTTYYEYSLLLFIFAFYYSGRNKRTVTLLMILLALFCGNNLLFSGRITALQELICVYLIVFEQRIKKTTLLIGAFCVFLFMSVIGDQRSGLLLSADIIDSTVGNLKNRLFALDTAYSAYFTSLSFIQYKNLGFGDQYSIFLKTLLSVFLGGGLVPGSNLAEITHERFAHDYGGVYPFFGNFYFGTVGVIIYSIYLVFLLNKTLNSEKQSDFLKLFGIYIISSSPRWYLYSTSPLTRSLFIFAVVYVFLRLADNTVARAKGR